MSGSVHTLPRIGALATLPGREHTLAPMVASILPQLDHIFVYLDGHTAIPSFLTPSSKLTILMTREEGAMRVSTRWMVLKRLAAPVLIFGLDDDILYPADYTARLADFLGRHQGPALAGVHGRTFLPPHRSYARNCTIFHFSHALETALHAHEIGSGTCAFVSHTLPLEPRSWPLQDCDDICLAIEAQRRGLPRILIDRPAGWLQALAEDQPDSLWRKLLLDDSRQSVQMRRLLALYGRS